MRLLGGTITIKPITMMAIDGGLLLLILFSKPWRLPSAAASAWQRRCPGGCEHRRSHREAPRPAAVESVGAPIEAPATADPDRRRCSRVQR